MLADYCPVIIRREVVDTLSKLQKLARKMDKLAEWAFDTETNTLRTLGDNNNFLCVGVSISWGDSDNYYIPLNHRRYEDIKRNIKESKFRKYLGPIFAKENIRLIGQNIKFDMHVMSRLKVFIRTKDLFDTMVASWLCDENSPNGLKENTEMLFGIPQTHFNEVTNLVSKEVKKEFGYKANQKVTFDLVLIDDGYPYAIDDSFYTWHSYLYYLDRLEAEKMDKIYWKSYAPFIRTLFHMEEVGVTVDTEKLEKMRVEIEEDVENLKYQMFDTTGYEFNPGSSQQLSKILFGYVPEPKKPTSDEKFNRLSPKDRQNKISEYKKKLAEYEKEIEWVEEYSFKLRPISKTATGAPQTNADTFFKLSKLSFKSKKKQQGVQLCKYLLAFKKLSKLKSAFIDGMIEQIYSDGKVHPSFNIIGTDSGRISCSNPNLQQLPKAEDEDKYQIRSLFIGSEYLEDADGNYVCELADATEQDLEDCTVKRKKIVAGDFSNLEMRVLAHFSEDKNLLEMFANDADTHGSTAVNMFELDCTPEEVKKKYPHLRQAAKVINFLLMYGGGAYTLYLNLRDDMYSPIDLGDKSYLDTYGVKKGEDVAQIYIDKYFDTYSGVSQFIKDQKRFAHKFGFVQTLLRRKRRLPDIRSRDFKKVAYCERLSVNSSVQGSAADITSSAQNIVDNDPWYYEHGVFMILQVHDELVFECPEQYVEECISRTKAYMEHPFGPKVELNLKLRADFDFGTSYQEAK